MTPSFKSPNKLETIVLRFEAIYDAFLDDIKIVAFFSLSDDHVFFLEMLHLETVEQLQLFVAFKGL